MSKEQRIVLTRIILTALLLVSYFVFKLFEKYENIHLEADDCDEFAMELKKLFNIGDDFTWDTYIYKGKYGCSSYIWYLHDNVIMSNVKEGECMSNFYTVSQYSAIFEKDSGNIRRMLINGTLEGEKVGNQWLIPKTAKPVEDRRLKSGKYRNWRNKIRINSWEKIE